MKDERPHGWRADKGQGGIGRSVFGSQASGLGDASFWAAAAVLQLPVPLACHWLSLPHAAGQPNGHLYATTPLVASTLSIRPNATSHLSRLDSVFRRTWKQAVTFLFASVSDLPSRVWTRA